MNRQLAEKDLSKEFFTLLSPKNISGTIIGLLIFNLAFNFTRLHDFSGLSALGKIKVPIISAIITAFFAGGLLSNKWSTQYKLFAVFLVVELIRLLFGFFIIQDFVVNDAWQFSTLRDMAIYFFSMMIPITYGCQYGINLRKIIKFLVVSGFMLSAWGITHSGFGPGGHLGDENDLCFVLIAIIPFCFTHAVTNKKFISKSFGMFAGILCILGVVATKSRGGFIGFAVLILFQFLLSRKKIKWIFTAFFVTLVSLPFVPEKYYEEIESIGTDLNAKDEGTIDERIRTWEMVIRMWKDPKNTVMGVGLGNSKWNYGNYQEAGSGVTRKSLVGREAHSAFFQILGDMGIWGILFIFVFLYQSFKQLFSVKKKFKKLTIEMKSLSLKLGRSKNNGEEVDQKNMTLFNYLDKEIQFLSSAITAMIASLLGALAASLAVSVAFYPTFWLLFSLSLAIYYYALKLDNFFYRFKAEIDELGEVS